MNEQPGFFDLEDRYALLSDGGDPLERLNEVVSFGDFRPLLEDALDRKDRGLGGRPPMDAVMMFKVLVLQSLYNLGDDLTEYLIRDRLSFMRFLGLSLADKGPDAKTIWLYKEHWTQAGVVEELFERFDAMLQDNGFLAMGGQIVDASIVRAPAQRKPMRFALPAFALINSAIAAGSEITVPSDTISPLPSTTQIEVSSSDTSIPT